MKKKSGPVQLERDGDKYIDSGIFQRAINRRPRLPKEVQSMIEHESAWKDQPIEQTLEQIRAKLRPKLEPYLECIEDIEDEFKRLAPGWKVKLPLKVCQRIQLEPHSTESLHDLSALGDLRVLELGDGIFCYRVSGAISDYSIEAETARDAINSLYEISYIQESIGKSERALFVASLELGRLLERISVRPFERFASTGRKVHQGGADGAQVTNADHVELHSEYQSEIDRLMEYGSPSGLSYNKALRKAAEKFGVKSPTVKRYTRNRWPRSGGRPKKT